MKAGTVKPWLSLSEQDVHASPGTQQHWVLNHCGQQAMEGAPTPPRFRIFSEDVVWCITDTVFVGFFIHMSQWCFNN